MTRQRCLGLSNLGQPDYASMEEALRTVAEQQGTLQEIMKMAEESYTALSQEILQIKQMMECMLARRKSHCV
ncbi:hypothetical protein WJX75_002138 [Coccomyxa subellipsoidea]|uniref:Uncharacterized protein n=1 Tax=Coccomyxa subellipsoidea TaxID=248742 RepID=A0ABR2YP86_9CHLO